MFLCFYFFLFSFCFHWCNKDQRVCDDPSFFFSFFHFTIYTSQKKCKSAHSTIQLLAGWETGRHNRIIIVQRTISTHIKCAFHNILTLRTVRESFNWMRSTTIYCVSIDRSFIICVLCIQKRDIFRRRLGYGLLIELNFSSTEK